MPRNHPIKSAFALARHRAVDRPRDQMGTRIGGIPCRASMETHADRLTIEWLPPNRPSIELVEQQRGHSKRTLPAIVLSNSPEYLVAAFRHGVSWINSRRNKMGFTFDSDDLQQEAA